MKDWKLTNDRAACVSTIYKWNHDMTECPTGCQVLLLGIGNTATVSQYNPKDWYWKGWFPLPKIATSPGPISL